MAKPKCEWVKQRGVFTYFAASCSECKELFEQEEVSELEGDSYVCKCSTWKLTEIDPLIGPMYEHKDYKEEK